MPPTLPSPFEDARGFSHRDAPDTERAAARLIHPTSGSWRGRVLYALRYAEDGLTDPEIADQTEGYLYTVAPRRKELVEMGWVVDSGRRRTTPRNRRAIVWTLSDAARRELGA